MYIRRTTGHVVYTPLSTSFTVVESGGSPHQKYDTTAKEYTPDLSITPYVLTPQLYITDPNGLIEEGDYSNDLVNCLWTVEGTRNGENLKNGTDYTIDEVTHALTLLTNLDPNTTGKISFSAQYVDARRGEVLMFEWSTEISCMEVTTWRLWLKHEMPKKISLSPFKEYGNLNMEVQMMNGDAEVSDSECTYKWQVLEDKTWQDIEDDDLWCESETDKKVLTVNPDYVNRVILLLTATVTESGESRSRVFFLRRYYSSWEEEIYLTEGSYMGPTSERAVANVKITNKNGIISNPTDYFDIELFFCNGNSEIWRHVSYGTKGIVTRSEMGSDDTVERNYGTSVRELTANIPILSDEDTLVMVDEDTVLVGQFPTIERGV